MYNKTEKRKKKGKGLEKGQGNKYTRKKLKYKKLFGWKGKKKMIDRHRELITSIDW